MAILPPRTSKTILFSLVDQAPLQVLAVSDSTTPKGDVGCCPLLLQLSDDGCRTIAAIRNRFIDPDLVTVFHAEVHGFVYVDAVDAVVDNAFGPGCCAVFEGLLRAGKRSMV